MKFSFQKTIKTLAVLFLLWLAGIVLCGGLLASRALRLQKTLQEPASLSLNLLAENAHGARLELTALRWMLSPALWAASPLNADAAALNALLAAGDESLSAADESLAALAPTLGSLRLASFSLEQLPVLLDALTAARPALLRAEMHLARAESYLAETPGPLSPALQTRLQQAGRLIHLARQGILAAQAAPGLLGQTAPRTYLILIQNSDELRPTGGFISAVGRLQLQGGKILSLSVQDAYAFDDFSREYPYPPRPLLDYMGSEQWLLRDANWSPDFPSAARDVIRLYQISRPEAIDGVIAINTEGMQRLMAGLEPLLPSETVQPVTSANLSQILREAWNPPADLPPGDAAFQGWLANRKQFLGIVLRAALEKLMSGDVHWNSLIFGALDALEQRHLLLYSAAEADLLHQTGWDGGLRSAPGDFLMTVDANLGFSKSNALMKKTLSYQVALQPDGSARAVLDLRYTHTGTQKDLACTQVFHYDRSVTYQKMLQRCYFDYLRVLTPTGSQLLQASPRPVPGNYLLSGQSSDGQASLLEGELPGWTVFGQFFVVENGKTLQTRLEYRLPQVAAQENGQWRYRLFLQKQAGAPALPLKIQIVLPPGARLISSQPEAGTALEFDLTLDADQEIDILYALAP
ncbi:MAG: hypothetical protein OHK0031_05210 [Anaerolineales bacterium]